MKNVLVGQSGGPTAVINSSLAGVYETAKACGAPHVYGMQYGIEEKELASLKQLFLFNATLRSLAFR